MNNEKLYVEKLDECAKIKIETKEVHQDKMKKLKKMFKAFSKMDPKFFKFASDLNYYTGGYPKEDSPAKIFDFMNLIGSVFVVYKLLNRDDQINGFLKETFGIEIKESDTNSINRKFNYIIEKNNDTVKFIKDWQFVSTEDFPGTLTEFLKIALKESKAAQAEICANSDFIKEETAPDIEEQCGIRKANFVKGVDLKVKQIVKGKEEVLTAVQDINDDNVNFNAAVKPILE